MSPTPYTDIYGIPPPLGEDFSWHTFMSPTPFRGKAYETSCASSPTPSKGLAHYLYQSHPIIFASKHRKSCRNRPIPRSTEISCCHIYILSAPSDMYSNGICYTLLPFSLIPLPTSYSSRFSIITIAIHIKIIK